MAKCDHVIGLYKSGKPVRKSDHDVDKRDVVDWYDECLLCCIPINMGKKIMTIRKLVKKIGKGE